MLSSMKGNGGIWCIRVGVVISLITYAFASDANVRVAAGSNFKIYFPFANDNKENSQYTNALLSSPEVWMHAMTQKLNYLRELADIDHFLVPSQEAQALKMYKEFLAEYVMGTIYGSAELSVEPKVNYTGKLAATHIQHIARRKGGDWPGLGITMTGKLRLNGIFELLVDIAEKKVDGAIIETGVWRGGMSVYMRAILRAMNQKNRLQFVCDSFSGLPSTTYEYDQGNVWDHSPYLEVSDVDVRRNFVEAGLGGDKNIVFVKGLFSNTMPQLAISYKNKFALLRLDGDMYESTVDVLYHFYGRLSVGGYVYMDDWDNFPSKTACLHFFKVHNINPAIRRHDEISAYWQKTEEVDVQFWRYEKKQFT